MWMGSAHPPGARTISSHRLYPGWDAAPTSSAISSAGNYIAGAVVLTHLLGRQRASYGAPEIHSEKPST